MAPIRPSRVLSVMFTDIKGFSERTSAASREDLVDYLNRHDELLIPVIQRFGGRVVKTIGDSLLAVFDSPTNAVLAGLLIQERLRLHNAGAERPQQLPIRVAINSGEVEERNGDVFGEAVNIAARMEALAEPGEVYFSESVYLAMNKAEVPTCSVGRFHLRGIPEDVCLYRVLRDPDNPAYNALLNRLEEVQRPAKPRGRATKASQARLSPMTQLILVLALTTGSIAAYVAFSGVATEPSASLEAEAQQYLDSGDNAAASSLYSRLLEERPNDQPLAKRVVSVLGVEQIQSRAAWPAAQQAALLLLGQLDEQAVVAAPKLCPTLTQALFGLAPHGEAAEQLRTQMRPCSKRLSRPLITSLDDPHATKRLHAMLLLKSSGQLTAKAEQEFHWRNLTSLPYGYKRELTAAIAHFSNHPFRIELTQSRLASLANAPLWRAETAKSEEAMMVVAGILRRQHIEQWAMDSAAPVRANLARRALRALVETGD